VGFKPATLRTGSEYSTTWSPPLYSQGNWSNSKQYACTQLKVP